MRRLVSNTAYSRALQVCLGLLVLFASSVFAIDMKVDRVTVNVPVGGSVTWASVTFQSPFGATPVVFVMPSSENSDPATVRIRNITTTGFEVGVNEPPGEDGRTAAMTIDYFAAEPRTYTFPGATRIVVGTLSTTTHQGRNVPGAGWDTVNFGTTFGSTPAIITQVQTINSQPTLDAGDIANPFLEVAVSNVSTSSMLIALERAETSTGTVVAETIGYLAMESGDEVTLAGETIKAQLSPNNIQGWDNGCFVNAYSSSFSSTPLVVASQNSRDGGDGGWARRCSTSSTGVGLAIDEDQSGDSDRSHTTEEAGILAISAAFHGTRNGSDIEAGSVTIPSASAPTAWTSVNFPNAFSALPRLFALPTTEGTSPAALRVRNISVNGFEIAAFVPTGSPSPNPEMTVDYIAIIDGEHVLPNGDVFEVGSVDTNLYQAGLGGSTGTETVNFSVGRSLPPAVLMHVQSVNNEPGLDPNSVSSPWLDSVITGVSSSQMNVALERSEALAGTIIQSETIAYFAVSNSRNEQLLATDTALVDYEMFRSPNNILGFDDGCFNNSFVDSFSDPHAVAKKNTRNGNNGGWLRRCNLDTTQIGLVVEEDQANDSERSHISETASIFVFSRAFEAEFTRVDHYAISHGGSGITCEAEPVSIIAHDVADVPLDASGSTIRITATSSSPGWLPTDANWTLASGTGSFSTPSAGVAEYQFGSGEAAVDLRLANVSVADIDIDVVNIADGSLTDREGTAEDPLLSFAETGLRFYDDADGDGNADGTNPIASPLIAGTVSTPLILRTVQTDTETGACIARVSGSQSVAMAYECVDPATCIRNQDLFISGSAIEENNAGSVSDFNNVALNFDAEGEAPFTMQYFDVGSVRLHARLALAASGSDPALTLTGASATTVVRPADIVVTAVSTATGGPNPGTTTTGSGFVTSGSPFQVTAQVRNSAGGSTPNYGNEASAEGITLNLSTLVMPVGGLSPPLSSASSFLATGTGGEFRNSSLSWPEAGTIQVSASVADGDYLGTGNLLGTESGNIGRFYPDHFSLSSASVDSGCALGGFSYMSDQAFSYLPMHSNYTIRAETAGAALLQNYDESLGYPVEGFNVLAENNNDGADLSSRVQVPLGSWSAGEIAVITADNTGFRRQLSAGNEIADGPYTGLQFGLAVSGSGPDTLNFQSLNFNPTSTGDCTSDSSCSGVALGASQNIRFGRVVIVDAFGPESAPLAVFFETEYWDGAQFVSNGDDSCTAIAVEDISFDGNNLTVDANRTVTVGGGSSTGNFGNFTPLVEMTFVGGDAQLSFSAPGAGNTGEFEVDINLTDMPWLRFDWNNDGDAANDTALPTAQITFGTYRGHDRVIFWREVFD